MTFTLNGDNAQVRVGVYHDVAGNQYNTVHTYTTSGNFELTQAPYDLMYNIFQV